MLSDSAADKLGFDTVRKALTEALTSPLGKEKLASLRPVTDPDARKTALAHTDALQRVVLRGDPIPLEDFLDVRQYLVQARPSGAMLTAASLDKVRRACRASRLIHACFRKEGYGTLAKVVSPIVVLRELEETIAHAVDSNGTVRESASGELRRIRRRLRQRRQALREKLKTLLGEAVRQGYAAESQLTVRAGRMVIPLRADAKRKMRGFVHDSSATGQTVYLEPAACLDMGNEVRILEAQEQREIERILREVTGNVREEIDAIECNLDVLGNIDLLHAKALLSVRLGGVVPMLSDAPTLDLRAGKNPALCLREKAKEIIPLTLSIGGDVRTLVITGPNAGGKTVAMKTCGLLLVMLGCGIPIPVHPESVFGCFRRILVEIGDEQSIEQDLSTFSARISGLQKMCDAAARGTLLLVDEIGTGTDPAEGAALAQAVLEHFTDSGALTIVTTHHGTLKAYAHENAGTVNGSMDFDERTLQPTFLFRQGLPGSSYAFRIADQMNFSSRVLARARQIIGKQGIRLESLMASYRELNAKLEARLSVSVIEQDTAIEHASPKSGRKVHRKPGKAAPLPDSKFAVGQQVVIDAGSTPCEIISVEERFALVSAGNVRMRVALDRIRPIDAPRLRQKGTVKMSSLKARIDVRGLRVQEALAEVEKLVDQGMNANLPSVEIVHGVGTGALRSAIHEYLKAAEVVKEIECMDVNPGVTNARIT
ncbi:MAG: endonuclease MutS2 [Rhodothermaceae bacterium]|nr:endonuclease MutS2 [Rhodothermaceae bacterium]MYF40894.1 endonuclease MutS2 [Rhodothermaceae bacterium]